MSFYSIPPLLSAIAFLTIGLIVVFKSKATVKIKFPFLLYCLSTCWWQSSWFVLFNLKDDNLADLIIKIGYTGIILIPVTVFHFYVSYFKKARKAVIAYYIIFLSFLPSIWFTHSFINSSHEFFWGYYPKAGHLHLIFLLALAVIAVHNTIILIKEGKRSGWNGITGNQIKYLFAAFLIYCLASSDFLVNYGWGFYPFGYIFILLSITVLTYAISKYHLINVNVAFVRFAIVLLVYSQVLVLPFFLATYFKGFFMSIFGEKWWFSILVIGMPLAVAAPYLNHYLRQKAENILLLEHKKYRDILDNLGKSVVHLREIDMLARSINETFCSVLNISFSAVYLCDQSKKSYNLSGYLPQNYNEYLPESLTSDTSIIKFLSRQNKPSIDQDIAAGFNTNSLGLVIPCQGREGLLGFVVLGQPKGGMVFSEEDVNSLQSLSFSIALAIENCLFWQEIEDRQRKARLKEMDAYSYALAHEIDNPMQAIMIQASLIKENVQEFKQEKQKELNGWVDFIMESAARVSALVKAIREYGHAYSEATELSVDEIVESFHKLYSAQFKSSQVVFKTGIEPGLKVKGHKPELMQVLVILANNSLDALKDCALKEITVKAGKTDDGNIRITFADTGCGIKKELLAEIFAPFTTTKGSQEGTGMGLYNAKKIIERHGGTVWAESEGEGKGAAFIIELNSMENL